MGVDLNFEFLIISSAILQSFNSCLKIAFSFIARPGPVRQPPERDLRGHMGLLTDDVLLVVLQDVWALKEFLVREAIVRRKCGMFWVRIFVHFVPVCEYTVGKKQLCVRSIFDKASAVGGISEWRGVSVSEEVYQ